MSFAGAKPCWIGVGNSREASADAKRRRMSTDSCHEDEVTLQPVLTRCRWRQISTFRLVPAKVEIPIRPGWPDVLLGMLVARAALSVANVNFKIPSSTGMRSAVRQVFLAFTLCPFAERIKQPCNIFLREVFAAGYSLFCKKLFYFFR